MKIVITGHTSGIGKGFYDYYLSKGHEVLGFSRSTGHDLTEEKFLNYVAIKAINSNIFINNAYAGTAQAQLMYKIHEFWKDRADKTMVVIGSRAPDFLHPKSQFYAVMKSTIDIAAEQLTPFAKYHLLNVRPSWVRTPMLPSRFTEADPAIEVDDFVEFVTSLIENSKMRVVNVTIDTNAK